MSVLAGLHAAGRLAVELCGFQFDEYIWLTEIAPGQDRTCDNDQYTLNQNIYQCIDSTTTMHTVYIFFSYILIMIIAVVCGIYRIQSIVVLWLHAGMYAAHSMLTNVCLCLNCNDCPAQPLRPLLPHSANFRRYNVQFPHLSLVDHCVCIFNIHYTPIRRSARNFAVV